MNEYFLAYCTVGHRYDPVLPAAILTHDAVHQPTMNIALGIDHAGILASDHRCKDGVEIVFPNSVSSTEHVLFLSSLENRTVATNAVHDTSNAIQHNPLAHMTHECCRVSMMRNKASNGVLHLNRHFSSFSQKDHESPEIPPPTMRRKAVSFFSFSISQCRCESPCHSSEPQKPSEPLQESSCPFSFSLSCVLILYLLSTFYKP